MPEIIIQCPQCQRQLRVPEELMGRVVKCPTCNMAFTVTPGAAPHPGPRPQGADASAPPPPVPPPPVTTVPASAYQPGYPTPVWQENPRQRVQTMVLIPGILLLLVGLLGLLWSGYLVFSISRLDKLSPAEEQMMRQQMQQMFPQFADQFDEMKKPESIRTQMLFHGTFAVLSLVVLVGTLFMLAMRVWPLALLGSLAAFLNMHCCCILGWPFAIWALVVLFRPDVRAAFSYYDRPGAPATENP